jgi:signal recognition particle receptor subunit beta
MALINIASREIHCKIVYYGPGLAGKTTNLQYIHWQIPKDAKGDLLSVATETERTLFFDFRPSNVPTIRGFHLRFHLYTVPGCVLYERTRVATLNGADGVVFVADSQKSKIEEDIKRLRELAIVLTKQGQKFHEFPLVLQYNKRDVPGILTTERMDQYLNTLQWPRFEAVAVEGDGVMETLDALGARVIDRLQTQIEARRSQEGEDNETLSEMPTIQGLPELLPKNATDMADQDESFWSRWSAKARNAWRSISTPK